jgi:hypothetical protein
MMEASLDCDSLPDDGFFACFCASVIRTQARLDRFRQLLQSIANQTVNLHVVAFSIHIDPSVLDMDSPAFFQMFEDVLGKVGMPYFLLKQRRAKRQFVQIEEMTKRLDMLKSKFSKPGNANLPAFIMFSDDDDLWSPIRVMAYLGAWNAGVEIGKGDRINTLMYVERNEQEKLCCTINCAADVSRAISQCNCIDQSVQPLTTPIHLQVAEFQSMMVREFLLVEFFEKSQFVVQNNRFADIAFFQFVNTYDSDSRPRCIMKQRTSAWLYFYRLNTDTHSVNRVRKPMLDTLNWTGTMDEYVDYHLELFEVLRGEKKYLKDIGHRRDVVALYRKKKKEREKMRKAFESRSN